ncbi:MAG: magnesium transporter, partial [Muribaculaceae bacterium]|nr:magnesium transporter [Muribaculaceae bacterium]
MKEYTDEYLEQIKEIINRGDIEAARAELASMHPAEIAGLYQNLNLKGAEFLYKLLDEESAADVLIELDEDDRLKL